MILSIYIYIRSRRLTSTIWKKSSEDEPKSYEAKPSRIWARPRRIFAISHEAAIHETKLLRVVSHHILRGVAELDMRGGHEEEFCRVDRRRVQYRAKSNEALPPRLSSYPTRRSRVGYELSRGGSAEFDLAQIVTGHLARQVVFLYYTTRESYQWENWIITNLKEGSGCQEFYFCILYEEFYFWTPDEECKLVESYS